MAERLRTARPRAQLRQGRTDWYKITNSVADGPATVHVYDEIGYWGVTAQDFISELKAISASAIDLHINSPGGEIFDGIAIMNALRSHPAKVTTYVDSLAASIASVIAMAGDRVVMAPHSQMMIHDGSGLQVGNAAAMREMADLLDRQSDNIASVYAEKAGGTVAEWRTRMTAETWYTADEAVAAGLADEVSSSTQTSPDDNSPKNSWDLSVFAYAGRSEAPAPPVPALVAKALPVHHTATVDEPWDGPAAVAAMPNDATVLHYCFAWQDSASDDDSTADDPDGDPDDEKSSYKFPHHKTKGGPANLAACRDGLARLEGSSIPDGDKPGVKAHLQAHLDDAEKNDDDGEGDGKPSDAATVELTDWDPTVFRAAMARASGELPDGYSDVFRNAVHTSAADAPAVPAPTVTPVAVEPGWAPPAEPAPEPERNTLAEIFRAALTDVANHAAAPTAPPPAAQPDPEPFDPTVVTRALREEVRR
jgi:ATP-dependent protease ClpP protease subunit